MAYKKKRNEEIGPAVKGNLKLILDVLSKWLEENFVQEIELALRGIIHFSFLITHTLIFMQHKFNQSNQRKPS